MVCAPVLPKCVFHVVAVAVLFFFSRFCYHFQYLFNTFYFPKNMYLKGQKRRIVFISQENSYGESLVLLAIYQKMRIWLLQTNLTKIENWQSQIALNQCTISVSEKKHKTDGTIYLAVKYFWRIYSRPVLKCYIPLCIEYVENLEQKN